MEELQTLDSDFKFHFVHLFDNFSTFDKTMGTK